MVEVRGDMWSSMVGDERFVVVVDIETCLREQSRGNHNKVRGRSGRCDFCFGKQGRSQKPPHIGKIIYMSTL
jgi:hypothetical protein